MKSNIIVCPCGLHGRAAIELHQLASSLPCLIWIERVDIGRSINCSSLIGILSLGVKAGDEIKITIGNGDIDLNYSKIIEFLNSHM